MIGAELVYGFGVPALPFPRAELLTELALVGGGWRLCAPRIVRDGGAVDADGTPGPLDLTEWLLAPSVTSRFGRPGG